MSLDDINVLLVEKFGADIIVGEEAGILQPALLIHCLAGFHIFRIG